MNDLYKILDDYLATRHAMGYKLQHVGRRLLEFVGSVLAQGKSSITTKLAVEWATKPTGASPKWWAARLARISHTRSVAGV
jgi:integrase/recombinase XerD